MDFQFELDALKTTRENAKKMLSEFSPEALNKIPKGFNNNLIWNYGHMVVTQQLLCYKLSNLPMYVDEALVKKYAKDTQPTGSMNDDEFEVLKALDAKFIEHFASDYKNKIFKDYKSYTTSYGVTINNIDEAISFNNLHEGVHFGYIMSMRKQLM